MEIRITSRLPYLVLVIVILVLDRWSKWMIDSGLSLHQTISVIDGFFNITYVANTGIAFGILNSLSSPAKTTVLCVVAALAAIGVTIYSLRNPASERMLQAGLSLILAGALGNLYDRIRYGYVIDFLEFYIQDYSWPSFNVADAAISMGVAFLALEILRNNDGSAKVPSRA